MAETKLGQSLRAAKASQNSLAKAEIVDVPKKEEKSQGKEPKISVRVPSAALKKHWQIKAIQDDTSISEAVLEALIQRWGYPDES